MHNDVGVQMMVFLLRKVPEYAISKIIAGRVMNLPSLVASAASFIIW